jgi:tripartite-type tricarboxylate transporter receptor subunit TctC
MSSPAALYKLNFNVLNDFAPVAMVAYSPHFLVTSSQVPANIWGLAQNRSSRHGQNIA